MVVENNASGDLTVTTVSESNGITTSDLRQYLRNVWRHMGGWVGVGAAVVGAVVTGYVIQKLR